MEWPCQCLTKASQSIRIQLLEKGTIQPDYTLAMETTRRGDCFSLLQITLMAAIMQVPCDDDMKSPFVDSSV